MSCTPVVSYSRLSPGSADRLANRCARVAITERRRDEFVWSSKPVVHAPGVDADRLDGRSTRSRAALDLLDEPAHPSAANRRSADERLSQRWTTDTFGLATSTTATRAESRRGRPPRREARELQTGATDDAPRSARFAARYPSPVRVERIYRRAVAARAWATSGRTSVRIGAVQDLGGVARDRCCFAPRPSSSRRTHSANASVCWMASVA